MAHATDAPPFVLFEDWKDSEKIMKKWCEEMATKKDWDYSDVVWGLKLQGDLNIQEKNFVK